MQKQNFYSNLLPLWCKGFFFLFCCLLIQAHAKAQNPPGCNLLVNPYGMAHVSTGWTVLQGYGSSPYFGQLSGSGFIASYAPCGNYNAVSRKAQTIDLVAAGYSPAFLDGSPNIFISEQFKTAVANNNLCNHPSGLDKYYLKVELRDAANVVIATVNFGSAAAPLEAPINGITHSHTFSGYPSGVRYIYFEDGGNDVGWWGGFYGTYMENATVLVADNVPPIALCKDVTVQLDGSGNATTSAAAIDNGSNDECGIASLSLSQTSFNCGNAGNNTVTLTVTDNYNNQSTCTANVLVQDNQAPSIACPSSITVNVDPGTCGARVLYPSPTASDNCAPATPAGYTFHSEGGGSYYYLSNSTANYATARANARADGGHLAVVTSAAEHALIPPPIAWLGGSDAVSEGTWVWDTYEPFIYNKWANNEPNNSGDEDGIITWGGNTWNDHKIHIAEKWVLEVEGARFVQTTGLGQNAIFPEGTTTNTFVVTDASGNTNQCSFTVTVVDNIAPVPNVANLPTLTGECSASVSAPTATDNCEGAITGTTSDPTSYSEQGTYTITWTYDDGNGNTSQQTQTVVVDDVTAPVPDVAELPTITGECSASVSAPTATDNCEGAITGTTSDPTSYSGQGTYTITWTYDDGNGNTSQQTQTVVVDDVTAPVPDVANLPTVTGECSASVSAPTATDNCEGTITGTTSDPTSYSEQGTYTITWTYDDGNGNTSQQTQTVVVDDVTAPVPDVAELPTITGECSASVSAPTATDNCEGTITGTTSDPTSYSEQGTYTITWTYDDGNGNTSQQTQTVVVDDVTAPVPDVAELPTITGECSASVSAPTATDNCEGTITGTTSDPTSYSGQGTYTITWTYDDGNGNTSQQTQTVVVDDVTAPVPDVANLPTVTGECNASVSAPTATDNCEGTITGTTSDPTSYSGQGTYTITWTYDDGNGNTSQQTQSVVVDDVTPPSALCKNITVQLNSSGTASITAQSINNGSNDNCGTVNLSISSGQIAFDCGDVDETFQVVLIVNDGNGNTSTCTSTVTVSDNSLPDDDCDGVANVCDVCDGGDDSVDNNNDGIADCSQLLSYNQYSSAWHCGNNKIKVCHNVSNNPHTNCINKNALSAHFNHGDYIGPCTECGGQNLEAPVSGIVNSTSSTIEMELFPNPANDEVNIHLHGIESAAVVTIFDQLGRTVLTTQVEEGQLATTIHLGSYDLKAGIYFVTAESDGEKLTRRLVVSR